MIETEVPPSKLVSGLFRNILQQFGNQNCDGLSDAIRDFYKNPKYDEIRAQQWNADLDCSPCRDKSMGKEFFEIVSLMKQFREVKAEKGTNSAFKLHLNLLTIVMAVFENGGSEEEDKWIFKPLRDIIRATKKIFIEGQRLYHESGGVSVKKDDLIYALQRFKASRNIRIDIKREILPLIDNMQVSLMMKYHNYDQIRMIIEPKKSYGEHGPLFEDNYLFQRGKVAMINQRMLEAESYFQKINLKTRGQKRLVLRYLIPCKIFLGKMFARNPQLQDEYFPEYEPIIQSIIKADFGEFSEANQKYQKIWIKRGIYLLMDRLRKIVWRNLIKKLFKIYGAKINMLDIEKAVKLSGGKQKIEECICIISNLIYENYIQGYIFQNQNARVLVLKKDGGFPKLSIVNR